MDTPYNQSVVNVKAEPAIERNEEQSQCEGLHMEIKIEESHIFDHKVSAMLDIKTEPVHEFKMEKMEENPEPSSYQMNNESSDEMDAEYEVLGPEAAENVANKIVVIKRWMFCVPFKAVVEGTPFVPFKMPFCGSDVQPCSSENRFQIADLMQAFPNIGLIIDLSNNRRTYPISDLSAFNVQYVNIPVQFERSSSVPDIQQLNQFLGTWSIFSNLHPDKLIGVHDQLGNRATAYMICKGLEQAGMDMKLALKRFTNARGYPIYTALAAVLRGNRRPWIPKSKFKPDSERLGRTRESRKQRKARRRANKKQEAKGTVSTQTKCEFVQGQSNIQIQTEGQSSTQMKCEFDPNIQIKTEGQSSTQMKCEFDPNIQLKTEGKSKKQRKAERRALKERNAKLRAANDYKDFLTNL